MDVEAVFVGLRDNANTIPELRCFEYVPDSIAPPCFFPVEVEIEFDRAFGRGMDELTVRCQVLVAHGSDRSGQRLLKGYLAGDGPLSLKAALHSDPTLGGACDDLRVRRVAGYRLYVHNGVTFYGAELDIHIIGEGD
ncbi:hypothetical protein [Lentzea albida]|uniref:Uncharacterized protein n=1 Tax=Lentzea albida TaxID=65499 RepID=A0A1H9VI73_9PSEU|nr:hypothetical protein [Lentzea albida]SES20937.1 hypothetical protein SAMN04488000_118115 [Lentzea albida]